MNTELTNRPAPKFNVGDWAFNNHKGHNARVVSVVWEEELWNGYKGGYRYSVPGLSDPSMYAENPVAPYVEYEKTASGAYRQV